MLIPGSSFLSLSLKSIPVTLSLSRVDPGSEFADCSRKFFGRDWGVKKVERIPGARSSTRKKKELLTFGQPPGVWRRRRRVYPQTQTLKKSGHSRESSRLDFSHRDERKENKDLKYPRSAPKRKHRKKRKKISRGVLFCVLPYMISVKLTGPVYFYPGISDSSRFHHAVYRYYSW